MRSRGWGWVLAFLLTLVLSVWQRLSGPTYPVRGRVALGDTVVTLKLSRSHGGEGDQPVRIQAPDEAVGGEVAWRRFPTTDPWQRVQLQRSGEWLEAALPKQPPAGTLEYQVRLHRGDQQTVFPPRPAVTRFKGAVPAPYLIAHIAAMIVALLCAARAGFEALVPGGEPRRLAWVTLAALVLGGFILGPVVQKYAFDAWWTGVPFGWDLTDNKTLVAGLAWLWAVWRLRGGRPARWSVVAATIVTLAVFAVPHSVWGSQIDWSAQPPVG